MNTFLIFYYYFCIKQENECLLRKRTYTSYLTKVRPYEDVKKEKEFNKLTTEQAKELLNQKERYMNQKEEYINKYLDLREKYMLEHNTLQDGNKK